MLAQLPASKCDLALRFLGGIGLTLILGDTSGLRDQHRRFNIIGQRTLIKNIGADPLEWLYRCRIVRYGALRIKFCNSSSVFSLKSIWHAKVSNTGVLAF